MISTNDEIIRITLRATLEKDLKKYRLENKYPAEIFEEFGVRHGTARIDIAVINGILPDWVFSVVAKALLLCHTFSQNTKNLVHHRGTDERGVA